MNKTPTTFIVIGNPENRRSRFWVDALRQQGQDCRVVAYLDILKQKISLQSLFRPHTCIRLESPGENFEVTQQLIALGANHVTGQTPFIEAKKALTLKEDRGRIRYMRQWFLGFRQLLQQIENQATNIPSVQFVNAPQTIALLFDKMACQATLAQNKLPIPPTIGKIENYEHFKTLLNQKPYHQVFLKPIHGSSASGVLAYRCLKDKEMITSSVEMVSSGQSCKLYNSLKIRKYTQPKIIRQLINILAKEGLRAEQWIPKASNRLGAYDFRVVTVKGQARHTIVRQSQSPMTNLHLGNRRGNLEKIIQQIGQEHWQQIQTLATQTAQHFQDMTYIGMDILLTQNHQQAMVIELNAFGDLLPNCWDKGETTYEAVASAVANRDK